MLLDSALFTDAENKYVVTEHKDEEREGGENEMRTRRWRRIRVTLRIIARKLLVDRDVCRSETKAIITTTFRSWATVGTREQKGHKSALSID
jgi:hypothetical protein